MVVAGHFVGARRQVANGADVHITVGGSQHVKGKVKVVIHKHGVAPKTQIEQRVEKTLKDLRVWK